MASAVAGSAATRRNRPSAASRAPLRRASWPCARVVSAKSACCPPDGLKAQRGEAAHAVRQPGLRERHLGQAGVAHQAGVVGQAARSQIAVDGDIGGVERAAAASAIGCQGGGGQDGHVGQARPHPPDRRQRHRPVGIGQRQRIDRGRIGHQRLHLDDPDPQPMQRPQQRLQLRQVAPAEHDRQRDVVVEQRRQVAHRVTQRPDIGPGAQGFGRVRVQAVDRHRNMPKADRLQLRIVGGVADQRVGIEADHAEPAILARLADQRGQRGMQRRLPDALEDQDVGRRGVAQDRGEALHRHMGVAPGAGLHPQRALAAGAA